MKTIFRIKFYQMLIVLFGILLIACQNKNSQNEASSTDPILGIEDFPQEWVMLTNFTPDSIIPYHVVQLNADSSYQGTFTIKKEADWTLNLIQLYSPSVYKIKAFKKTIEAEMIYYHFTLIDEENASVNVLVNFRENPDNPQSSVFDFSYGNAGETITYEFVSKELSKGFPIQMSEDYD